MRIVSRANRLIDVLARGMNRCAGWLFVLCALFVTFDVLARKFLGFSSQSTTELSGYMPGVASPGSPARSRRAPACARHSDPEGGAGALARLLHWLALARSWVLPGSCPRRLAHHDNPDFGATDNSRRRRW
jgi:hypothetical protein